MSLYDIYRVVRINNNLSIGDPKKMDIKEHLKTIKAKAVKAPKSTRGAKILPVELVETIKELVNENNGSFATELKAVNMALGFDDEKNRAWMVKNKLNAQAEVKGKLWKVGVANGGELYKFALVDAPKEE